MRTVAAANTIMMVSANSESTVSVPLSTKNSCFVAVFSAMRIYVICDRKKSIFVGMLLLSLITPAITAVSKLCSSYITMPVNEF